MELDPREYENLAVSDSDVRKIVLAYLVHNCFKETAETFISCTGMKCAVEWSADIDKRNSIYNRTMEGNALKAIELTNQLTPDLLQNNNDVLFDLLTLHFVELVRAKNCTGALEFAQRELTSYGKLDRYIEKLQDFMTLLAYEEPEKSPVFQLLSMDHRQNVADSLNRAVLSHLKLPSYTSLERLLQQVTIVRCCLNQEAGKDGAPPFSLKTFLKS